MSAFSLEKEPFPEAAGDEYYFSTPALTARLEDLCGAIDRGHVLLVDEEASGKSTMLDSFAEASCERWRIFRLQARARMSAKKFVHELVSTFGLAPREPAAAQLSDVDSLPELLTTQSRIAVIVIDDAHLLESMALEQILFLVKRWERYCVRFLICAEPDLMKRLESLHQGGRFSGSATTLDMPRFDHEQVSDYLHMCLFRAGLVGDSPFDPAIVANVTEKACGLVGAIDPIARELLDEAGVERRDCSRGGRGHRTQVIARRWPVAVVTAAALGVLMTIAIPGFSTSQNKVESRRHLDVFRSSITLAPEESVEKRRERSASADSAAP
jgi:type II secretory pathway predicted ATPase ExeA